MNLKTNPILLVPIVFANMIFFGMMMAGSAGVAASSLVNDIANQNVAAQSRAMGMVIVVALVARSCRWPLSAILSAFFAAISSIITMVIAN